MNGLRKICEKPPFLGILGQNDLILTVLSIAKINKNTIFSKNAKYFYLRNSKFFKVERGAWEVIIKVDMFIKTCPIFAFLEAP